MSVESIGLVLNHSRAKGTAKLVLVGIANHDGDGGSWPSIATLARYANVDGRSVQRAISSLVAAGEVVVHAQDGGTRQTPPDRRPNRYTITVRPANYGVTPVSPRGDDGVTPATERGDAGVVNGVTQASPEPSLNHPEPSSTSSTATPPTVPDGFDAFWAVYPRRVGKDAARKAFAKAVDRLSKQGIDNPARGIAHFAQVMAEDPNLPEARFVPHPATWLNRGGWDDEPYPAPKASGRGTTDERVADAMRLAERLDGNGNGDGRHLRAIGGGA